MNKYLTGPLVVDGDTSSNCSFLDGVAVKGCGIAQVLECGVKILILTALRVTTHIATKLVGRFTLSLYIWHMGVSSSITSDSQLAKARGRTAINNAKTLPQEA